MANKFFNYSFQVRRTKITGIIFIIFVILVLGIAFFFYKNKNDVKKVKDINYRITFGMNEFEDKSCDKAYRINYKKETCSTICIKVFEKDTKYLETTKDAMLKNGFTINKIKSMTINKNKWRYFNTKEIPIVSYYSYNYLKKTYAIEVIDQSKYLSSSNQKECKKISNKFFDSIKIG